MMSEEHTPGEEHALFDFPSPFPIKAMGRNSKDFQSLVTDIVLKHAKLAKGEQIRARESGESNFVSITVVIEAQSRAQLDQIYRDLTDCEQVLMAL